MNIIGDDCLKLGIALSGGGIRGIAHVGVLKALEDYGIKPEIIGGTSSGAIVASLYALGYSPRYIYVLFKKYAKVIARMNVTPFMYGFKRIMAQGKGSIKGLRNGEDFEEIYDQYAIRKGMYLIREVEMPLVITSVDIMDCREYIFTNYIPNKTNNTDRYILDIPMSKAVIASCSFPAFFSPFKVEKHMFMDGGVLDNVPVNEVKKQGADKVIAVKFQSDNIDANSNVMDIVMKTIDIMGSKISEEGLEMSDYILNVYTDKTGLLDVKKLDSCYKYGYNAVVNNIDKIKKIIVS